MCNIGLLICLIIVRICFCINISRDSYVSVKDILYIHKYTYAISYLTSKKWTCYISYLKLYLSNMFIIFLSTYAPFTPLKILTSWNLKITQPWFSINLQFVGLQKCYYQGTNPYPISPTNNSRSLHFFQVWMTPFSSHKLFFGGKNVPNSLLGLGSTTFLVLLILIRFFHRFSLWLFFGFLSKRCPWGLVMMGSWGKHSR